MPRPSHVASGQSRKSQFEHVQHHMTRDSKMTGCICEVSVNQELHRIAGFPTRIRVSKYFEFESASGSAQNMSGLDPKGSRMIAGPSLGRGGKRATLREVNGCSGSWSHIVMVLSEAEES